MKFKKNVFSILIAMGSFLVVHARQDTISKQLIARYLPNNPIILEAGAHIGDDTIEMTKLWPHAKIYAFEPVPNIFEKLKERTTQFSSVICCPYALGDKNGTTKMYISSGAQQYQDASSSLLKPKDHLHLHPTIKFEKEIEILVLTIDEWAHRHNISHIDFMWLDLQGSEPAVLSSSPNILKTVKVIHTEVSLRQMYTGTKLYPQFKKWLEKKGFKVVKEVFTAWEGNVLFVRKSKAKAKQKRKV